MTIMTTTKTEREQPIEFRLRYPKRKAEEVCAFNEVIEKVVINEDVLAEEAAAVEEEKATETESEVLNAIEEEEEREKRRKEEEARPEKIDSPTCL